jgi:hypothetical protein
MELALLLLKRCLSPDGGGLGLLVEGRRYRQLLVQPRRLAVTLRPLPYFSHNLRFESELDSVCSWYVFAGSCSPGYADLSVLGDYHLGLTSRPYIQVRKVPIAP